MASPYGTIVANPDFHAAMFAEKVDRALRVDDKETVVRLLTSVNNEQRQMMREPYKIKYGKEMVASLDKKLGGDVEKLVDALLATPLEYDLKQLKKAMKGAGTDEAVLIEILCSRTPQQMEAIRIEYEKEFQKPLDEDVASDTSGEFREVLRALVNGSRDDSKETDDDMAHEEAARLYDSGNAKLSSKEAPSHFQHLLCTENQYQLRKIFDAYILLSGTSIEDAIEKEFSGDLKNSYLTIVRAATNKQNYFATQLYNAMKGLGSHDNDLIRAIVSRSEVDLELIKEEYKALYGNTLEEAITSDTSGLYRDGLLAVVKGNREHS